ncbi:MAG: VCBS repeat-containing protein [Planctomycetales bacterium]|nr:VCBS repeat-containing protein [Planctomycetales bacterium]
MKPASVLRRVLVYALALLVIVTVAPRGQCEDQSSHDFKKLTLTREFLSEGANFGDFDGDGTMDMVAGQYWYRGPDFQEKVEYQPGQAYDPKGYAPNFFAFTHDMNGDEWTDIIIIDFPGKETWWFENPQGKSGHWKRHMGFDVTDNESPWFTDVTGDGRPELVCHTKGRLGYAEPNWDQPEQPWTFHPVSGEGSWHKYTHGFGVGDVNGDGKKDLMMQEGWWEQPDDPQQTWPYHAADLGNGGAQMYAYDVDGDGDNDVITSIEAHGYGLAWFENEPQQDGSIQFKRHLIIGDKSEISPYGVKFSQLHAVDLVDMNDDGLQDIVTGKRFWAHGPTGDVEPDAPAVLYWFELRRTADGVNYVPHRIDDDSGVGTQIVARDINGDGLPEIALGNKKGAFVFLHSARPGE